MVLPLFDQHSPAEERPLSLSVPLPGREKASVVICFTPRQSIGLCRYLFLSSAEYRPLSLSVPLPGRVKVSVVICSTPRQSKSFCRYLFHSQAEKRPLSLSVPNSPVITYL
ncbi:hypothetical protein JTE90_028478 [Oedothorax gibbosus]|uniref:Uncharacterized protein n=1 Tax=Oedothorax gibbosus TaxID=931172 RepID=A0AAV6VUA3_9ARAC|nr:hypothetical protein JTE90_028478 [Oedothorax gibbosus]